MTFHKNGDGTPPSTRLTEAQPLTVAGAALITTQAVMAAVWGVVADAHLASWMTTSTQALITAALTSVVTLAALVWAAHRMTPKLAPILAENTVVGVTNGTSHVVATATIPSAADAVAVQANGSTTTQEGA